MMKLFALFFAVVLSVAASVVVLNTDPVVLAGLAALLILASLSLVGLSLHLQAKIAVAKLEAGRPILPPAKAAPVVVMSAQPWPDPVDDDWHRQGYAPALPEGVNGPGTYIYVHDRQFQPDPGNQPPARRPRQWRVVNG